MSTARTLTRAEREAALAKMEAEIYRVRARCFENAAMDGFSKAKDATEAMALQIQCYEMATQWHAQLCAAEDAELQRNTCH